MDIDVDVTIHHHFIHHIDNERIIDVLYRDHDYTVSNFNKQCQIIHQWFNVWGLSERIMKLVNQKENWVTGTSTMLESSG